MTPAVVVDWSPDSPLRYRDPRWTVVAIDVIRATTTAVTAVVAGHSCYPAASLEDARRLAESLDDPVLAGELEGEEVRGFHIQNSPAAISRLATTHGPRDVVLLSTSGTTLMTNAMKCAVAYVACLRNLTAQIEHLADQRGDVAVLGAGSGGAFRPEDALCCALIAHGLARRGFAPDRKTARLLEQHEGRAPIDFLHSDSVDYLRRTGQTSDLHFILSHVDDVADVFTLLDGQVVRSPAAPLPATASS